MADCTQCGAHLTAGVSWCGQCYAPVDAKPPPPPALRGGLPKPEARVQPVYSRWRGGPSSFGPAVKIAITVAVLALAPLSGSSGNRALYWIGYGPIALLILWGVWRKQRVS